FYESAKYLGFALKIMDIRNKNTGKRSFMEGNLFTYTGDGFSSKISSILDPDKDDSLLSFSEGVELLMFVYSGGQASRLMYKDLLYKCPPWNFFEKDPFGRMRLSRECVKEAFRNSMSLYFNHLPYWKKYLDSLKDQDQEEMASLMLALGERPGCTSSRLMEAGDLSTIATIVQYIERVFLIYDKDMNGVLDEKEALLAYPRFKGLIARMIKKQQIDEKILETMGEEFLSNQEVRQKVAQSLYKNQRSIQRLFSMTRFVYWYLLIRGELPLKSKYEGQGWSFEKVKTFFKKLYQDMSWWWFNLKNVTRSRSEVEDSWWRRKLRDDVRVDRKKLTKIFLTFIHGNSSESCP
ncbi:MAG: hypothetical protein D6797_01950, partial [Bdellovibrio sp.]